MADESKKEGSEKEACGCRPSCCCSKALALAVAFLIGGLIGYLIGARGLCSRRYSMHPMGMMSMPAMPPAPPAGK